MKTEQFEVLTRFSYMTVNPAIRFSSDGLGFTVYTGILHDQDLKVYTPHAPGNMYMYILIYSGHALIGHSLEKFMATSTMNAYDLPSHQRTPPQ